MAIVESRTGKRTQDFKSCKECAKYFGEINLPNWMFKTELCLVFLNKNWSKEIIEAIDTLKKTKITTEMYETNDFIYHITSDIVYDAINTLKNEGITGLQFHETKISCKIERKN
jgi:hypothetical protein